MNADYAAESLLSLSIQILGILQDTRTVNRAKDWEESAFFLLQICWTNISDQADKHKIAFMRFDVHALHFDSMFQSQWLPSQ